FSPKVVRATMGALWGLDMVEADDLAHVIAGLRNGGYTVYGADLDGLSTRHWDPAPQSVLVLGSEAHGLGADTRRHLDATIAIPGAVRTASTESLNVATAGAVLMYEWTG